MTFEIVRCVHAPRGAPFIFDDNKHTHDKKKNGHVSDTISGQFHATTFCGLNLANYYLIKRFDYCELITYELNTICFG